MKTNDLQGEGAEYLYPKLHHLWARLYFVLNRSSALRGQLASLLRNPIEFPEYWEYQGPDDTSDYTELGYGKAREQGRVVLNVHNLVSEFEARFGLKPGAIDFSSFADPEAPLPSILKTYGSVFAFSEARKTLDQSRVDRLALRLDTYHIFLQKWRQAIMETRKAVSAAIADLDGDTKAPAVDRPSTRIAQKIDAMLAAVPSDVMTLPSVVVVQLEWLQMLDAAFVELRRVVDDMWSVAMLPAVGTEVKQAGSMDSGTSAVSHADDFSWVNVQGTEYRIPGNARTIVAELFAAAVKDDGGISLIRLKSKLHSTVERFRVEAYFRASGRGYIPAFKGLVEKMAPDRIRLRADVASIWRAKTPLARN